VRRLLVAVVAGAVAMFLLGAGGDTLPVLYSKDWTDGVVDSGGWFHQCKDTLGDPTDNPPARRGTVTVTKGTGRFDLQADGSLRQACEMLHSRTHDLGTDDYYALEVFFPRAWKEPGDQSNSFWGLVLAQFNFSEKRAGGPPVGLAAHRRYVNLTVQSGYFDGYATQWRTGNGSVRGNLRRLYAIPRPLKLAAWHQLIVHVRWSTGNDGAVDVWHKLRGKRQWKQTVRLRGVPTVQWSAAQPAVTDMVTWDKFGAYRGASRTPLSVWHDDYCRASSLKAAKSCQ
jgi:hypothetical protein